MKKKLTDKQERFSQLVVKYGNQSKAYREAYDVKEGTKETSINVSASKLMADPNIMLRANELRREEKQEHKIDREFIIKGYLEIINDTNHVFKLADLENADSDASKRFYKLKELTSNADKIRAMENLAKMLGMNAPKKIDVNITSFKTNWGE
jgi:hypothetical protein